MPFSQQQFSDNATRLKVIIFSRLDRPPLSNFHKLNPKEQRLFNLELNSYIRALPLGKEEETIISNFNAVCNEEIYHDFKKLKIDKMVLPSSTKEEIEKEEPEQLWKLHGPEITLQNL